VAEAYEAFRTATSLVPENSTYQSELARVSGQLGVLLGDGRLRVRAVLAGDGEPVNARHAIDVLEPDLEGNRARLDYKDGAAAVFELASGTYWVTSSVDHAEAGQEVRITAARDHDTWINLNAGRVRLSAVLADGRPPIAAYHYVYRAEQDLDGNRERIDYRSGEASWFTLPAGTYYVQAGADELRAGREVRVMADRETDVVIDLSDAR